MYLCLIHYASVSCFFCAGDLPPPRTPRFNTPQTMLWWRSEGARAPRSPATWRWR